MCDDLHYVFSGCRQNTDTDAAPVCTRAFPGVYDHSKYRQAPLSADSAYAVSVTHSSLQPPKN
jgi:hypothetical protein